MSDKPYGNKPSDGSGPASGADGARKPASDRPSDRKPGGDRPRGGKPSGDRPYGGKPGGDRPYGKPGGDRPYGGKPGGGKPFGRRPEQRKSLTQELIDLEYDIANAIARRTELLARAAKARRDKGLPVSDANQERSLRRVWDVVAGRESLDVTALRGIYTLANGMAYSVAVRPESGRRPFVLAPLVKNVDLTVAGPRSQVRSRLLAAVAAAAGADCTLAPVVLNDPLVELVKALNQAGAEMSWENASVISRGGALSFADKTVFAGGDALNLYLLLAFALPQVGRMTFTGGTALKLHDLSAATQVFAGLGARLTGLEPNIPGLPARLESAGVTAGAFRVPDDFPAEAALALAVAGPSYPEGLRFTWGSGWQGAPMLRHAKAVLSACGVPCELTDDSFSVAPGAYAVPAEPQGEALPLDPVLSAYLLALPRVAGGQVTLSGAWPEGDPEADAALALLGAAGLKVDAGSSAVRTEAGPWPEALDFEARHEALLPLAVALGLCGSTDARIAYDDGADTGTAEAVAERVGRFARTKPGRLVLVAGKGPARWGAAERPLASPSTHWTLGLSLLSVQAPGITLSNPGALSETWPGYLTLLADNFTPREKEPEKHDGKKKGRRVRLD